MLLITMGLAPVVFLELNTNQHRLASTQGRQPWQGAQAEPIETYPWQPSTLAFTC